MKSLFLEITTRCNIVCLKCPNRYFFGRGKDISRDLLEFILFKALCDFSGKVLLATGEPTLRPDYLLLLLKWTSKDHLKRKIVVFTNGTLLDTLPENLLRSEKFSFVVSLDGMSNDTVSRLQKGVNFSNLQEKILRLRKCGTLRNLELNMTLNKYSRREIKNFFEFAKKLSLTRLHFTPLLTFDIPNKEKIKNLQLSNAELEETSKKIFNLGKYYGINVMISTNSSCHYPRPIIHIDGKVSYCEGREGVYVSEVKENLIYELEKINLPRDWCKGCIKKSKSLLRDLPLRLLNERETLIRYTFREQRL